MKGRQFQRTIEDFTCSHCGSAVQGNGYTNHCPKCLWSKHVDINPGDRQEQCRGEMEPICVESKQGSYIITHRCQACGIERRIKADKADDFEAIIAIARN